MPADWEIKPDVDITVALCTDDDGVIWGYWDDAQQSWMDYCTEAPVQGVQYWAQVNGAES